MRKSLKEVTGRKFDHDVTEIEGSHAVEIRRQLHRERREITAARQQCYGN